MLYLFFPRLCLLCKRPLIKDEQQICLHCFCDLPRTNYAQRTDHPILNLYGGIPQIREAGSFLFFEKEGKAQTLLHSLKYYNNKELAMQLGRYAALEMQKDGVFNNVEILVPVPLHPKKERKRGYNQSEWIARGFASVYQCPINTDTLFRNIHTDTQTRKTSYERHLNVEKIFDIQNIETFSGKHILLVDDVITTGATTNACIRALTTTPDIQISLFSLAIVPVRI
jgi:ComF family protein